jgi:hypothetical protein
MAAALSLLSQILIPGCFCDFLSYHEELDIRTGRIRTTNYLMFLPVWSTTHDTVITESLPDDRVDGVEADWQKVNTFYWLIPYSPHWVHHGTLRDIGRYENATRTIRFTPKALQHVALRTTDLWQSGSTGSHYLYHVIDIADQARADGTTSLDVADIASVGDSGPAP